MSGRRGGLGCWGGRGRCRGKRALLGRDAGFGRLMKPGVGLPLGRDGGQERRKVEKGKSI